MWCSTRCRSRAKRDGARPIPDRVPGPVTEAVRADVGRLGLAGTVDAAQADALALVIDDPGTSASGLCACVRELRAVLVSMEAAGRASAPSIFDNLLAAREARRAGLTPLRPGAS